MTRLVVRAPLVWLGPDSVLPDGEVVCEGGRIAAVAEAGTSGASDPVVEVDGFLMPGIADRHVHVGLADPGAILAGGVTAVRDLAWPAADIFPRTGCGTVVVAQTVATAGRNWTAVNGDQAGTRARLDGHVADRHAAFHAQGADGRAGELDGVAGAAGRADLADDGQHDVLGAAALGQRAFHLDQHVLGLLGQQGLGGQHMLHFGGADAVGQRAEGAVGGGMGVAAHDSSAREGEALFRTDDVANALADVELVVIFESEQLGVLGEVRDLVGALGVRIGFGAVGGRDVVVDDQQRLLRALHLAAREAQPFERLRRRHLVNDVSVDGEQAGAVGLLVDQMVTPDLVVERARFHRSEP